MPMFSAVGSMLMAFFTHTHTHAHMRACVHACEGLCVCVAAADYVKALPADNVILLQDSSLMSLFDKISSKMPNVCVCRAPVFSLYKCHSISFSSCFWQRTNQNEAQENEEEEDQRRQWQKEIPKEQTLAVRHLPRPGPSTTCEGRFALCP